MPTQTHPYSPLRRARKARGMRPEELAAAAGVSIRTVQDAELDRHRPHSSSKRVIAQALGMDPSDLWPADGEAA